MFSKVRKTVVVKRRLKKDGGNRRVVQMCPGKGVASGFVTQNASHHIPGTFVRAMPGDCSAWKNVLNALFLSSIFTFNSAFGERSKRTVTTKEWFNRRMSV